MLRIYNTLTRSIEEFKPLEPSVVRLYSCGPTVYDFQHIGHMRRYVGDDILIRVLKANGYKVDHVMNITDVGHLVSDSDTGEDKMEKGAKKYGESVWDIAKRFEKQFLDSIDALGIQRPSKLMHATDYIKEQIALIQVLEEKGYTYTIADGVYYDTSKFPHYFDLSRQNPKGLEAGARVKLVEGKKNPTDFALWKFSIPRVSTRNTPRVLSQRQMEWESPWPASERGKGLGFPGWHIECSAMSMKALGPQLDIHTGGIDHINIHHTNEIAQSEAATGKKFVNYWVHHNFLTVENEKMSKSLGNFFTVQDVVDKKYDPLALRYLYLQTHYRQEMNFTWESLDAAATAYKRLVSEGVTRAGDPHRVSAGSERLKPSDGGNERQDPKRFERMFLDALNDDLNTPKALAFVWELIKSDISSEAKIASLKKMDEILGLELFKKTTKQKVKIPKEVQKLVKEREVFRKAGDFAKSDELRKKIADLGFTVQDTKEGPRVRPKV